MYLAKRPCGKISAASWDDENWKDKDKQKTIGIWLKRGDTVKRVERFYGGHELDWICNPECEKCEKTIAAKKISKNSKILTKVWFWAAIFSALLAGLLGNYQEMAIWISHSVALKLLISVENSL